MGSNVYVCLCWRLEVLVCIFFCNKSIRIKRQKNGDADEDNDEGSTAQGKVPVNDQYKKKFL